MSDYIYTDKLSVVNPNIILLENYISSRTKILHQCLVCKHKWKVTPNNILSKKSKCPACSKKSLTKCDDVYKRQVSIINASIIPIEKYKNCRTKILHRCLVCTHKWKASPPNILIKSGCPICSKKNSSSKGEKEVAAFIKEIYNGLIIENDRTILRPKELDVYLPEICVAFEYNGDYWHRDKPKGYHSDKTTGCADQGIKLLHIWECDWNNNPEAIKNKIRGIIYNK